MTSADTIQLTWPDGGDPARLAGDSPKSNWSLCAAGDWAAARTFAEVCTQDAGSVYGDILPFIRDASVSLVNLECALGGTTPILKDGISLRGASESAAALAGAGFDVACLGNNHVMDFGVDGLVATVGRCRAEGLVVTGAGMDIGESMHPAVLEREGVRIGILSLADREEGDAGEDTPGVASVFDVYVLDRIREARAAVDVLILVVHGGKEYAPVPSPYWMRQVFAVAGAGADLVIGHHPHVPQGVCLLEREGRVPVPVCFSTGNFLFKPGVPDGVGIPPLTDVGYVVQAHFSGSVLERVELVPYRIQDGMGVRRLRGGEASAFCAMLEALSAPLASRSACGAWFDAFVDHAWEHGYRERLGGLTEAVRADNRETMRHARSHHNAPAHTTLIDRALLRRMHGLDGTGDPEIRAHVADWFAGTWPPSVLALRTEPVKGGVV